MSSFYQRIFITFLVASLAHTAFTQICFRARHVHKGDCMMAIQSIQYKHGDVLDTDSNSFKKFHGDCVISFSNDQKVEVPKSKMEESFAQIFRECDQDGGVIYVPFKGAYLGLTIQNVPVGPNVDIVPPQMLLCGRNTNNAPMALNRDCQRAYDAIPFAKDGTLVGYDNKKTSGIFRNFASCSVYIHADDGSHLTIKKSRLDPIVDSMIETCKGKSGVHELIGGTTGLNGMTVVKIRSSVPCGPRNDPSRQYCT